VQTVEVDAMASRPVHHGGSHPAALPLLGAAVVAGAVVGWQLGDRHPASTTPAPPATSAPSPVAMPVAPSAIPDPAPPARPRRRAESPVCGWDPTPEAGADPSAPASLPSALRARTMDALDARLLSHPDPAVRAAGLLIAARARPAQRRERIEQLARLATASRDPRLYALAQEGCRDAEDDGAAACQLLEPAQWAQLDPANAVPWLTLAEAARAHGDAAAEDDAMYHAARARYSDPRPTLVPALVEQALTDAPPHALIRTLGLAAAWKVQAGWSWSSTAEAMHYCMADDRVLTDGDRAATCDLLAGMLAQVRGSPIDSATAHAIGVRLRWPADRLDALADQTTASGTAARQRNVAMDLSCRGVDAAEASLAPEAGP
jgi:hypothetical protein